ncbi:MAG TPA: hypothetical protein RMH85_26875 [Polyangiaceae bacterium LLY-WYZ-15_(1-7)]|nr:hypothetical protein [Sandaracinus sp.]HJL01028.1 hypothetical protein [Polyangiaceae bacterium LLY-WYZ-15_(1-7)]HJL12130.1 hypothetical protein [Polyangiaceae bacterium LLY-WYZ-15_(1-7)]
MLAIALDAAMGSSWAACVGAGVALLLAAATTPLGPGLSLAGLAAGALGAALSRALGVEAPLGWLAAALAGGVLGGVTVERTRTHRWAPTAVASLLALSVLAAGSVLSLSVLRLRFGALPVSVAGPPVALALVGVGLGLLSLAASVGPWRALRRAVRARGGRLDAAGHIRFYDGEEGRARAPAEGEVLAWATGEAAPPEGYRRDAGPPRFEIFVGDRATFVDRERRRAMRWHLAGLAAVWGLAAPALLLVV